MLRRLIHLLIVVILLLFLVVITTPLRFVSDRIVPEKFPTGISDLRGTVMKGSARIEPDRFSRSISHIVPSAVGVSWQWCPTYAIATWCVKAKIYQPQSDLNGTLRLSFNGWSLSDTRLLTQLNSHPIAADAMGSLLVAAQLRLDIKRLQMPYRELSVKDLNAQLLVRDLSVSGELGSLELGTHRGALRFDRQTSAIKTRLQGSGGTITKLNANADLKPKSYRYQLSADSDDPILQRVLQRHGEPSQTGGYILTGTGEWQSLLRN